MVRVSSSGFEISDSRIPEFQYSLKKILLSPAPVGMRGTYDFGKKFKDANKTEFFYFKYALILYILHEEKINHLILADFKKGAQILVEKESRGQKKLDISVISEQARYYSNQLPKVFGKARFHESTEQEIALYRYVYKQLYSRKYPDRDDEEWQRWFTKNEEELQIIPFFIVWFHEAILTILTLYDESLWPEHL